MRPRRASGWKDEPRINRRLSSESVKNPHSNQDTDVGLASTETVSEVGSFLYDTSVLYKTLEIYRSSARKAKAVSQQINDVTSIVSKDTYDQIEALITPLLERRGHQHLQSSIPSGTDSSKRNEKSLRKTVLLSNAVKASSSKSGTERSKGKKSVKNKQEKKNDVSRESSTQSFFKPDFPSDVQPYTATTVKTPHSSFASRRSTLTTSSQKLVSSEFSNFMECLTPKKRKDSRIPSVTGPLTQMNLMKNKSCNKPKNDIFCLLKTPITIMSKQTVKVDTEGHKIWLHSVIYLYTPKSENFVNASMHSMFGASPLVSSASRKKEKEVLPSESKQEVFVGKNAVKIVTVTLLHDLPYGEEYNCNERRLYNGICCAEMVPAVFVSDRPFSNRPISPKSKMNIVSTYCIRRSDNGNVKINEEISLTLSEKAEPSPMNAVEPLISSASSPPDEPSPILYDEIVLVGKKRVDIKHDIAIHGDGSKGLQELFKKKKAQMYSIYENRTYEKCEERAMKKDRSTVCGRQKMDSLSAHTFDNRRGTDNQEYKHKLMKSELKHSSPQQIFERSPVMKYREQPWDSTFPSAASSFASCCGHKSYRLNRKKDEELKNGVVAPAKSLNLTSSSYATAQALSEKTTSFCTAKDLSSCLRQARATTSNPHTSTDFGSGYRSEKKIRKQTYDKMKSSSKGINERKPTICSPTKQKFSPLFTSTPFSKHYQRKREDLWLNDRRKKQMRSLSLEPLSVKKPLSSARRSQSMLIAGKSCRGVRSCSHGLERRPVEPNAVTSISQRSKMIQKTQSEVDSALSSNFDVQVSCDDKSKAADHVLTGESDRSEEVECVAEIPIKIDAMLNDIPWQTTVTLHIKDKKGTKEHFSPKKVSVNNLTLWKSDGISSRYKTEDRSCQCSHLQDRNVGGN